MLDRLLKLATASGWSTYPDPNPNSNPGSNNVTLETMDLDDLLNDIPLPPSTSTSARSKSKTRKGGGEENDIVDILDKVDLNMKPGKKRNTNAKAKASDAFVSERKKAQVRVRVWVRFMARKTSNNTAKAEAEAKASDAFVPKRNKG